MKKETATDPPAAPFRRPLAVRGLSRRAATPIRIEADAEERADLAAFLGVARVDALRFEGEVAAEAEEGWRIRGRLVAELEQTCVVTLAPVPVRHVSEVERLYLPADRIVALDDVTVDPDEPDEPDPYSVSLDPGALALESLVLMLDPYPRAPGAALGPTRFAPPGAAPIEDEDVRPFAALVELKRRLEGGGG